MNNQEDIIQEDIIHFDFKSIDYFKKIALESLEKGYDVSKDLSEENYRLYVNGALNYHKRLEYQSIISTIVKDINKFAEKDKS